MPKKLEPKEVVHIEAVPATPVGKLNELLKPAHIVVNSSGDEVRTYTVEDHGDPESKAREYASKIGGSVK